VLGNFNENLFPCLKISNLLAQKSQITKQNQFTQVFFNFLEKMAFFHYKINDHARNIMGRAKYSIGGSFPATSNTAKTHISFTQTEHDEMIN